MASNMATPGRAVVTGSASGIGAAVAQRLLSEGWQVDGWDLQPSPGSSVTTTQVDVADYESVRAAAARHHELDLLVNCAGISRDAPADELKAADWDRVLAVNLSAPFYVASSLHGALAQRSGLVVNLASIVAHLAGKKRAAYCTSKAGVVMLTQVLAADWGDSGVRVVAVSPGYTRTPMVTRALEAGRLDSDRILGRVPMGRFAEPEEIAGAIVALTTRDLGFVNGTTVFVDGGWSANGDY